MKTVPLLIINRSDRNAKHRIDQVLHSNVISLGNRVLIKDIRPNCTVSSWRRQCCGCPQNPSVQHTFQFKTPLSSTPKTPQFNTPLNSTPKTPHFHIPSVQNSSVQHKKLTKEALYKLYINWGVCWTEGFSVLNWGILGAERVLPLCWTEVLKQRGLCGTEGYSTRWCVLW